MIIQFIGCWKMWEVILKSLLNTFLNNTHIFIKTNTDKSQQLLQKKYYTNIWINNNSNIVFICVKPNTFNSIDLTKFKKNTLFISIMAWITLKSINKKIIKWRIIRIMPNTPMSIWYWVLGYVCSNNITNNNILFVKKVFKNTWKLLYFKNEDYLDKITALSWSWPAYYYLFTEYMINKAQNMWFSENEAKLIIHNTFLWSAYLLEKSNIEINKLRNNITSKWWTTEKAIESFQKDLLNQSINNAIDSAYNKAKELSNKF
jgi:pyrroline-5-carboxylate reductase